MANLQKSQPVLNTRSEWGTKLRGRLVWLVVLFAVQALYFPINRNVEGGVVLHTVWDDLIPFWPVWAIPYLLSILWWIACFFWAAAKMDDTLYCAFVASALVVMLSSYVVFILFPTYVRRPVLHGEGWELDIVRWIYNNDRLNNAFPSGHTYTTMLIVFFWWTWRPKLRWLWGAIAAVVILSTLFTGQHNLLDPVGGLLWAWGGYRLGLWWAWRQSKRQ